MRITNPKNQRGEKLLSSGDFDDVSIKLAKTLNESGSITLTYEDVSDIELWEFSHAQVKINNIWCEFLPHNTKNEDGSITVAFCEAGDTSDFSEVKVFLNRSEYNEIADELVITIEIKINRYMGKTLRDSKLEDYDAAANIAGWKALGVEAKTTEPDNYPYADCSTAAELTTAGLDPSTATTIGKDVCLLSFDTFITSATGARTFPNVQVFEADLPSLVDGSYAFGQQRGYGSIQTFKGQIPNVQNATGMFILCTGLTEWTVDLPSGLTTASYMFSGCTGLTEWTVDLPSGLTTASYMFRNCKNLTEWTVDLPSGLTTASYMFAGCTGLTEWTAEMPSGLSNTSQMFSGCTGLTEWSADLPSGLTNASNMFNGCKLNKPSVQRITDSIPTISGSHTITIGIDSTQITQAEQNAFNATIVGKGWTTTWQRN